MPIFDMPERELRIYRPEREEPADFDDFWRTSLAEARSFPLDPRFEPYECGLTTVDVCDVTFRGWNGEPVKAWFIIPARREGRLPCVVEFIGYGGGRGFPHDWLVCASAGFAHLIMDTRGQGSTWLHGDTPDPEPADSNPHHPGFMTRGVLDPKTYYYRRVFVDAVRAIEAARSFDSVDPKRVAVRGVSQGGGISLAAAGLDPTLDAVIANVPFLCHYRRAVELVDTTPYVEITRYLKVHRDHEDRVFGTLAYFDGVNFAARARASALFSVGIMDDICPPSTVFAAYNHYTGLKDIRVWRYNMHDGGGSFQVMEELKFLHARWGV